jgi:hypothetical protein
MLKMEYNEIATLLQILIKVSYEGKDVPMVATIMGKLRKELEKIAPDTLVK